MDSSDAFIDLYQPWADDTMRLTVLKSTYNLFASQWNVNLHTNRLTSTEKDLLLAKIKSLRQQLDNYPHR
jgi:hypothetical protein